MPPLTEDASFQKLSAFLHGSIFWGGGARITIRVQRITKTKKINRDNVLHQHHPPTTTTTFCPAFQGISLLQQVSIAIQATEIFRPQEEKHKKNYIKIMTNEGKTFKSILSLQQRLRSSLCFLLGQSRKTEPFYIPK